MSSPVPIVVQLQRDALDREIPVTDLLRKGLVVARKLGLAEFLEWLSSELSGYEGDTPPYRRVQGQVKAHHPHGYWVPVMFEERELGEKCSSRVCGQSVPELEEVLRGPAENILVMPFPDDIAHQLTANSPVSMPAALHVAHASVSGILSEVRTAVLNWSLQLEEDGILGEELMFTPQERELAANHTYNTNHFYGDVRGSQVAQGLDGITQVNAKVDLDLERLAGLIAAVRGNDGALGLDADTEAELAAELGTLELQIGSPKPKPGIVRESLLSVRRILESAAGGAAAKLLLELAPLLL